MKAHGVDCCHGARHSRRRWRRGAAGGALFAVLIALMPKCPVCIAAWLGVIGLSGLAAQIDPRALAAVVALLHHALWLVAAIAVALIGPLLAHRFLSRNHTKRGVET